MKTIIITGANSGIGYETAKYLAIKGNKVIAASRRKDQTIKTVDNLNQACQKANSAASGAFYHLDLNDLQSVKSFAQQVVADVGFLSTPIKQKR